MHNKFKLLFLSTFFLLLTDCAVPVPAFDPYNNSGNYQSYPTPVYQQQVYPVERAYRTPIAPIVGTIIAPIQPPREVIYVAPRGRAPGPGWNWNYHPSYGYGWYHQEHGWRH